MEGIREEFSQLDGSTATPEDDIPEEMFKSTIDVHVSLLTKIIGSFSRQIESCRSYPNL